MADNVERQKELTSKLLAAVPHSQNAECAAGAGRPNSPLGPNAIVETYIGVLRPRRGAWSLEIEVRR